MKKYLVSNCYVVLLFLVLIIISFTLKLTSDKEDKYMLVTIQEGDTLWSISESYKTEHSLSNEKFVNKVSKINNVNPHNLQVGQQISIPVIKSTDGVKLAKEE
ncbi:cell division suppressor protein YneA [Cytobacillus kochii]|uniref:cell division suppressor protein YneA n=1 Tax=Cytobacillus kochii TaxID=859143 RepID=UPI00248193BF|nr:LysM peptidoglycan-binding domain-containing protein [Cytobacillus kochii]